MTKFKFGLEIHQRLDTCKLFCSCPSEEGKGEPIIIKRKLHASKGELGEKDISALFEQEKNKEYVYHYYPNCCCLVELDEEPPHIPKREILELAIEICRRFNCKIVDELHFMRKIIVDGSNVSGFQRTGLIGYDGWIEVDGKKIGIKSIFLEEESAGIVKDGVFRLDRLGIPLVEITTETIESDDPEFVKKVAEKIGLILRATRKVKRGIGTIRQDINLSIPDGVRVEIKGFQELDMIPLTVEYEILRQENLKKIRKFEGLPIIFDATEYFKDTESKLFKKQKYIGGMILKGFAGVLKEKITPTKTYGKEVSQHGKPYITGIIHTDENISKYKIEKEVEKIRHMYDLDKNDLIIFSFGDKERVLKGFENIVVFLKNQLTKETRKFDGDGNTSFMRPISGSSRMYPETDIPPINMRNFDLNKEFIDPEVEIKEIMEKYSLNYSQVKDIYLSKHYSLFKEMVDQFKPGFLYDFIKIGEEVDSEILKKILDSNIADKKYALERFIEVGDLDKVFEELSCSVSDEEIREEIEKAIKEFVGDKKFMFKAVMGKVMSKFKGKVPGKKISEMVKKDVNFKQSN